MDADVGELLVGAYLKIIKNCDVVDYNIRSPEAGLPGLAELDVVGLRFSESAAYLCEVSTHLGGLEYGEGYDDSIATINKKYSRQQEYAEQYLSKLISNG